MGTINVRYPDRIKQHVFGPDAASILEGAGSISAGDAFTGEGESRPPHGAYAQGQRPAAGARSVSRL